MKWKSSVHVNKYEFRTFHGYQWLKLLYHNMTNFVGFANEDEAKNCNTENRYSILGELNESFKTNHKFEFILEYPEFDEYLQWRQTNNPLEEEENGTDVQGFHPIHTDPPSSHWGGLALTKGSGKPYCFLNGTPKVTGAANILIAVGMYTSTWNGNSKNIPGVSRPVNIQYLWVKFPLKIQNSCRNLRRPSILLTVILMHMSLLS